jgi:signal transduction histidine kinase
VRGTAAELAETSGREVKVNGPESPDVSLNIDPVRIEEVVTNLIDNAMKYGPEDKPIDIEIAEDADAVRVAVRDHGPGIAPDQRERIFEAFHRAGSQTRGVGLGLHVAREIVKLHGGSLDVQDGAGGGAKFVMSLPRENSAV